MPNPRTRQARPREPESAVAAFVGRLGVRASVEQFEDTFRDAVGQMTTTPEPDDPATEFSPAERAALERAGADFGPLPAGTLDPVERTRIAYAALVLDALTVEEVAAGFGRDPSRIRQRLRERTLWSVSADRGSRLPRVQFDDDGAAIAGMGAVLRALPTDIHPVAILRFLTRPQDELRLDDDTAVSPRDWLRAGGSASEAITLARDLHVA